MILYKSPQEKVNQNHNTNIIIKLKYFEATNPTLVHMYEKTTIALVVGIVVMLFCYFKDVSLQREHE